MRQDIRAQRTRGDENEAAAAAAGWMKAQAATTNQTYPYSRQQKSCCLFSPKRLYGMFIDSRAFGGEKMRVSVDK